MKNRFEVSGEEAIVYVRHKNQELRVLLDVGVLHELQRDKKSITARDCGNKIYFTCSVGGKNTYIHRYITKCPIGMVVDHINRDTSDNRRSNLRVVSRSDNMLNQDNVLGVDYRPDIRKWRSRISVGGKEILLGNFDKYEEALLRRAEAERHYYPVIARGDVNVS